MARPKKLGGFIQFRVPDAIYKKIEAEAAEKGVSPNLYVRGRVIARYTQQKDAQQVEPTSVPSGPSSCAHRRSELLNAGILLCKDCGARKIRGNWIDS
jgi:hypothetical protein